MDTNAGGRLFREAWITGVKQYYPATPKEGSLAPWEQMASWEQESAMAVFEQVRQFVLLSGGKTTHLSREQKGRFVARCWIAQIYQYFAQPKASSVDDWEQLPDWQREADAAIFAAVEQAVMAEVVAA